MSSSRPKRGVSDPAGAAVVVRDGADLPMYRKPYLYDVAFGFRDIKSECDGILKIAERHGKVEPKRFLELACGPAHHLRELASRGMLCHGVDINPQMLGYARALCERQSVKVRFQRADMRTFRMGTMFDVALCLFDSFAQCTNDRDAIHTLRNTAAVLRKGGLLLIEFTHPGDYFGKGRSRSLDRWTQRDGALSVTTRFSLTQFNPVEETFVASLAIEAKARSGKSPPERFVMRWPQRMWLRGGIQYVTLASGAFDVATWYGDLDPVAPLDMSAGSWRMIAVLRRR